MKTKIIAQGEICLVIAKGHKGYYEGIYLLCEDKNICLNGLLAKEDALNLEGKKVKLILKEIKEKRKGGNN